jgi:DNA-binding response OmpR family regulator
MAVETRKRILVVDDEAGIGRFLSIKLGLSGYEVTSTTSGAEAIEMVRVREPDVILLDVLMPDVTGMDVIERVRSWSKVPIIVFTGHPDIIRFALKLGANDHIEKPFNIDLLLNKIKSLLDASATRPVENNNST